MDSDDSISADPESPDRPQWQSVLGVVLKFAFPVGLIAFLVYRIPPENWDQIAAQPKNYGLLASAILVAVAAMSVSFIRWCVLVRAQGIELSMLEAFRLGAIGYLLSFVSAGSVGGDLFKAVFLARRRPGYRVAAIASVVVDRGCGLYGLLILVAGGLWVSGPTEFADSAAMADSPIKMETIRLATLFLIVVGTAVLGLLILGGKAIDRLIERLSHLPVLGAIVLRIGPPLRTFHERPVAFGLAVLMSIVVQALLVISMDLIAKGLYADPPTLAEHFVIVPICMLVSALPLTPAGMGVLEVAMDTMYRLFQPTDAVASGTLVGLVFELVKLVIAVIGMIFYWTAGSEVRETVEAAEREGLDSPTATDG